MPSIDIALLALSTLLGLLMSRTSLCTVAGVQLCLRERRWDGMRPVLAASSVAGLVLLALLLLDPAGVVLPRPRPLVPALALGGVLLGVGALVNGACYLGSVAYLGRGNVNFLFTLVGLGLASRLAPPMPAAVAAVGRAMPSMVQVSIGLGLFALLLLTALWPAATTANSGSGTRARGVIPAAIGVGACAGMIYAMHPMWSYGALIDALARAGQVMWLALPPAALLFAGAIVGALLQHSWRPAALDWRRAARCLAGGCIMGLGARLVPGGNDMLLLWTIPGLAVHGLVAYAVMVATIGAATLLGERFIAPRRP
jgi:hypothetical protein